MRHVYFLLSVVVFAIGAWYVLDGLRGDFFGFVDAIFGVVVVLTGTLNLLNQTYGAAATGVRAAALGANFVLLVLVFSSSLNSWRDYVLAGLLIVTTVLGFSRRFLKVKSTLSNTPLQPTSGGGSAL